MTIRKIYLYLFALVGLVLITSGSYRLVDLGLRTHVFTDANRETVYEIQEPKRTVEEIPEEGIVSGDIEQKIIATNNRERDRTLASSIAQLIIGLPLFGYHWRRISMDNRGRRKKDIEKVVENERENYTVR